jgi:2-iminobutanoate/2-iminopropanoate deaminase
MASKVIITSDRAPKPMAAYSQAVLVGGVLYGAGQVGIDPKTGKVVEGGIREQTRQAIENVKNILYEAGMSLEDVVKVNVYLTRAEDFKAMNEVYGQYFKERPPARTTIIAKLASEEFFIEMDFIAQIKDLFKEKV